METIGESTGGYVHFGNVNPMILHESGISIQMPTQYRRYWDGRFIERKGYAPNLEVSPGNDALKVAIQQMGN